MGADLTGKTAIVTGGNSGIGVETARALAGAGANVVLTSRNLAAGQKVAADISATGVKGKVSAAQLDLADLASVKAFAGDVGQLLPAIDYLILNAGVMACPKGQTKDGFELQIGTNHFGHFALTGLLYAKLAAQTTPTRVIAVSSLYHNKGVTTMLDDINWEHTKYEKWRAYGNSKLANVLFAKELNKRAEGTQIEAFSLHPGVIPTPLSRHIPMSWVFRSIGRMFFMKTIPQGAATSVYAATAPELKGKGGAYLADCAIVEPMAAAQDAGLAAALWKVSETLTKVTY